jgi:hypothetical protein
VRDGRAAGPCEVHDLVAFNSFRAVPIEHVTAHLEALETIKLIRRR